MTQTLEAYTADLPDKGADLADHYSERAKLGKSLLKFPLGDDVPAEDKVFEVAKGVFWARIPMPWALDHINIYLIDDGDSWTVIDTGVYGDFSINTWEILEAKVLGGKPVSRVIATHLHPDHVGMAGWLVDRYEASLYMSQAEYLTALTLWLSASAEVPDYQLRFLFQAGVSREKEEAIKQAGFGMFKAVVHELPGSFTRLEDGTELVIGGRRWRVVIGRGHSPEHVCLYCLDEPLLIAGDQVLPSITSNVSVTGKEPNGNPLAHWFTSLNRMKALPDDVLVLPSHGQAFYGLHLRLNSLVDGHLSKLKILHDWLAEERSPVETLPVLFRRKLTGHDFYMALGEALAHIHLLESLDLAERRFDGEVNRFKAIGTYDPEKIVAHSHGLSGVTLRSLADFES